MTSIRWDEDEAAEARVARGAAWLDENRQGWERQIDLASLDLSNGCRCILGQLFSGDQDQTGYGKAMERFPDLDADANPYRHGFVDFGRTANSILDEAWISLIKERFASGLLSDER